MNLVKTSEKHNKALLSPLSWLGGTAYATLQPPQSLALICRHFNLCASGSTSIKSPGLKSGDLLSPSTLTINERLLHFIGQGKALHRGERVIYFLGKRPPLAKHSLIVSYGV